MLKKKKESPVVPDPANLTPEEVSAISSDVESSDKTSDKVSIEKMETSVSTLERLFNLSGFNFSVTSFKDSGSKCVVSLSNEDFDMTVAIKDPAKYGLIS